MSTPEPSYLILKQMPGIDASEVQFVRLFLNVNNKENVGWLTQISLL